MLYIIRLRSGYWQVLMDKSGEGKIAFVCQMGLFEFNVMPFGLSSAPVIFHKLI